MDNQTIW